MRAGRLRHYRAQFDEPVPVDDGFGGKEEGWVERYACHANIRYLRGGETVQAARLAGRQPVVVTIRALGKAKDITPAWRMRAAGEEWNIRAKAETEDRRHIELTCETGVAV